MKQYKMEYVDEFLKGCKKGNLIEIENAINAGIDVNEEVNPDITLITKGLLLALDNKKELVIKYFIEKYFSVLKINPVLFVEASKKGNLELIKAIIKKYDKEEILFIKMHEIYINDYTCILDSALCWAMENEHFEVVNLLKDKIVKEETFYSSFVSACRNNYKDVAAVILESGVDLTKTHSESKLYEVSIIDSALYWAIERDNTEIINYIINHKSFKKEIFFASFVAACKKGYLNIVKDIMKDGIDLNRMHKDYELNDTSIIDSSLYWAIENNHKYIIKFLISQKFDASKCDNAFIIAYLEKHNNVVFSLLLNGFKRKEWVKEYNFLTYRDIIECTINENYFIINLDELNCNEEKELKYFLLKHIQIKDSIMLISKYSIKNHIKKLGNAYIENFNINRDYEKVKQFISSNKK